MAESPASIALERCGLDRIHQGKVRDTYTLNDPNKLLMCATDRLSIFDFVLPVFVPGKGGYLIALSNFWFSEVLTEFENHLVATDNDVLLYIFPGKGNDESVAKVRGPVERCMVIKKLNIMPYELIFRHHIGGSVYKKYLETGIAGGHKIKPGLPQWTRLDKPIFTPSTKEDSGHDINIDAQTFYDSVAEGAEIADYYARAYAKAYAYAKERGILIVDAKMEGDKKVLADEVLTPDSSRFVDEKNFHQSMASGVAPSFFDKQVVRDWGMKIETPFGVIGINNLDPENLEHLDFVHNLKVPTEIVDKTVERYDIIFTRLTGRCL